MLSKLVLTEVTVILLQGEKHYNYVIMSAMASQITGVSIVYVTVCSGADKKNQSSTSLAFVRGIHRLPLNSPHKGPVTLEMFRLAENVSTSYIEKEFYVNKNRSYIATS